MKLDRFLQHTHLKSKQLLLLIRAQLRTPEVLQDHQTFQKNCILKDIFLKYFELSGIIDKLTIRISLTTCSACSATSLVSFMSLAMIDIHFSTDFSYLIAIFPIALMHLFTN